jgi:DNA-binding IclR family transcriptional regulator
MEFAQPDPGMFATADPAPETGPHPASVRTRGQDHDLPDGAVGSGIGVLGKAIAVLHIVATRPVGLTELCERSGLPRSTAHRLAAGLEQHRMLSRDSSGRWRLGAALSELANGLPNPLLEAAAPVLTALRDSTGESARLYVREGNRRTCVYAADPTSGLRDRVPIGTQFPMTRGAGAKVLAAYADPAMAGSVFSAGTLHEVRRRGWAESVGEREPGVASVSAPVRDRTGGVVAALSLSGPIVRLGRRPGRRLAPVVLAAADALQSRIH